MKIRRREGVRAEPCEECAGLSPPYDLLCQMHLMQAIYAFMGCRPSFIIPEKPKIGQGGPK
jgi:hypothetical protein